VVIAKEVLERLRPYQERGFLEMDNNTAERSTRAIALGRKNYLFMGSEGGGRTMGPSS
jgi:hypothetical protein